jgi:hypothetical protein
MKHDLNSISYHLCTTEIGDARYIYHTCPKKVEMSRLKPQQRQMSYLCGRCPVRYGMHHGPWKTTWGPILIKEGKTHGFHMYCEVFIVGIIFEIIMHIWNFHTVYVFLDSNFVVKGSNKCYHLNLVSKHRIRRIRNTT